MCVCVCVSGTHIRVCQAHVDICVCWAHMYICVCQAHVDMCVCVGHTCTYVCVPGTELDLLYFRCREPPSEALLPVLQTRKPRLSEAKCPARGSTAQTAIRTLFVHNAAPSLLWGLTTLGGTVPERSTASHSVNTHACCTLSSHNPPAQARRRKQAQGDRGPDGSSFLPSLSAPPPL